MPTQTSLSAVATVFQNVFGRVPNSQESSGWATQLDIGATSAQLAAVLADSPEGAAQVSNLYQQVLGRSSTGASSGEIASGQAYLAQGQTNGLASLRTSMAASPEAQADIKAAYQNVLGRAASTGEISNAETALASGATLAQLYTSAEASPELTANLAAAYQKAFGTAPSAAVVAFLQQQITEHTGFSQLSTALTSLAASSGSGTGGGTGTPVTAQITGLTQDAVGSGYVDIGGTGQPGASISASITTTTLGTPHAITSPFAVATVGASGRWSVTNAPGSGGPDAGQAIPNGTYSVTPIETINGQAIAGTATSITLSGSGISISIPDTFNPAESMVASASAGASAPPTAATSTAASGASLVQLTDPTTAGITPILNS